MPDSTDRSSDLSELEGGVLGMVHASPGSTAHVIRERFRLSRSSHWSGSAGAIYPLMKKLSGRGWLAITETPRGTQVKRTYTITPAGLRELRRWLGPPLDPWIAAVTFDPIRTRIPFLGALSKAKQVTFLETAATLLENEIEELKRARKELTEGDLFWEERMVDGCLSTTRARLQWMRRTLEALEERG